MEAEAREHILRGLTRVSCTGPGIQIVENAINNAKRTKVYLLFHTIIDDFKETDNVGMAKLLHNRNFFFDLELSGIKLIDNCRFWGTRSGESNAVRL